MNGEAREDTLGYTKTGIISISTVKKLAAYHQYYAVNAAVASTLRTAGYPGRDARFCVSMETNGNTILEPPINYSLPDVCQQPIGDKKASVVWHTQGSGKSLSMVFYTGKIVLALDNTTATIWTINCSIRFCIRPIAAAGAQAG